MKKATPEELNNAAMQMILYAGNSRNMINEALRATENGDERDCVDAKMKEAKDEITKAHKIQTDMVYLERDMVDQLYYLPMHRIL